MTCEREELALEPTRLGRGRLGGLQLCALLVDLLQALLRLDEIRDVVRDDNAADNARRAVPGLGERSE